MTETRRWRYYKKVNDLSDEIELLYRSRGSEIEELREGNWVTASDLSAAEDLSVNGLKPLSRTESRNLLTYLRCGQRVTPSRLDLEPAIRYQKWKCPDCGAFTVVPAIFGFPGHDLMLAEREGHVVLFGCSILGDEPERPVACTSCSWNGEHLGGKRVGSSTS